MHCGTCDETPCICVKNGPGSTNSNFRSTYTARPLGLSKDEFGLDLFQAIYAASARLQCLKNAEMYTAKGLTGQAALEEKRAHGYFQELEAIVSKETIAPADLSQIMQQYGC